MTKNLEITTFCLVLVNTQEFGKVKRLNFARMVPNKISEKIKKGFGDLIYLARVKNVYQVKNNFRQFVSNRLCHTFHEV